MLTHTFTHMHVQENIKGAFSYTKILDNFHFGEEFMSRMIHQFGKHYW